MYLQDLHVENFVSRKPSTVSKVLKIVMIVLAVITFVLGLVVPYLLIMPLLFAALAWYYQMNSQIDFDYSYTNGVIEIAKVMNKSRRKQMLSVEMKGCGGVDSAQAKGSVGLRLSLGFLSTPN